MDASVRQELSSLLEQLTHSGSTTLDPTHIKKLKSICRSSDMYLRATYDLIMTHLAKDHAEVRLSSFQVIKELFSRSHLFRELLISEFQRFSALVTGTDPYLPLPQPQQVAAQLKERSLLTIKEWNDKYGDGYPKLRLGYNYLKSNKKVNFDELVAQTEGVRRRHEERAGRQRAVLQQKIQEVKQEMKDLSRDVEACMTQITSCFNLLMPRFDLPDIYSSSAPAPDGGSDGYPSQAVPEMTVSDENNEVGVAKGTRERNRTVSSCSFQSLSEDGDESEIDVTGTANVLSTGPEPDGNSDFDQEMPNSRPGSIGNISVNEVNQDRESEFLRRHYGISGDSGSETRAVKGKMSAGRKGKSPVQLTVSLDSAEPEPRFEKECREVPTKEQYPSESDSDSELEWEDVDPVVAQATPHSVPDFDLQAHGIASHGFSIPIQLDTVPVIQEDENNLSILTALRESKLLLEDHYLPTISRWMEWLSKSGSEDKPLRDAIDLKHKVQLTLDKFERIRIVYKEPLPVREESGEGDGDREAVVDKVIVTNPEWEIQSHSKANLFDMELDPTTPQAQIAKLKKKLSSQSQDTSNGTESTKKAGSTKNTLLSKAPVVPFDMDLYHWETPTHKLQPLTKAPLGSLHRFWVQEREVDISSDEQARMRCRTITYPGTFEPVEKTCRARLPSGKLCPRMDRFKCPFHGPIVPRDEKGNPVSSSSSHSTPFHSSSPIMPLDQRLAEAIRDAQGVELLKRDKEKKKKGGKAKAKKHPGLTDLKVQVDTPRARLERKIMSKRALKRVAESVDTANAKKYKDKFGYSFNYALSK